MGISKEPLLDIMLRMAANLACIKAHATETDPHEVTQCINSFFGALGSSVRGDVRRTGEAALNEAENCERLPTARGTPADRDVASLGDLLRLLRNGMARRNIEFVSDGRGQIHSLRVWITNPATERRTTRPAFAVDTMRRLLGLIEELRERFDPYILEAG